MRDFCFFLALIDDQVKHRQHSGQAALGQKQKVIFCASIYFFQVQYFLEDFYYSMVIFSLPLRVKNSQ